jgi:hypothetical protein
MSLRARQQTEPPGLQSSRRRENFSACGTTLPDYLDTPHSSLVRKGAFTLDCPPCSLHWRNILIERPNPMRVVGDALTGFTSRIGL